MNFKNKPILAMIHLAGQHVVDRALSEIKILEEEGVDGIIIENYHGDIKDIVEVLKKMEDTDTIKGINILPNEYHMSIPMCDTYGCDFVQLDHVAGIYQHGTKLDIDNYKKCRANFPNVKILGGVWPKYYEPKKGSILKDDLKEGISRADAIVVTGSGTGQVTPLDKIKEFRELCGEHPLIIGAGLNSSNVAEQLEYADGAIVGSCFKPYGRTQEMINRDYVREFMNEVKKVR